MSPRRFDSFLVLADIGTSGTMKRLTPPERWCFIAGILGLASKSPVRGALLIASDEPLTVDDIKDQAGVTRAVAKSCVEKLLRLDVLEHDEELGCLIVVNWHDYQREPKASDSREAWRERKQRQRQGHAGQVPDVTRDSHAGQAANGHADVTPLGHAVPFAPALAKGREGKG